MDAVEMMKAAGAAMTVARGAISAAQGVAKLASESGKLELRQQAVDLMNLVTELAQENMNLTAQVITLTAKVAQLEELQRVTGEMTYRDGAYWRRVGDRDDGPYCSRCWEADRKLLHVCPSNAGGWWCEQCTLMLRMNRPR